MNINQQSADGYTLLMFAGLWDKVDMATFLLNKGADVTLRNKAGDTVLSLARKAGHRDMVLLLRNNGAMK
jgi:ankyrin repeat protein